MEFKEVGLHLVDITLHYFEHICIFKKIRYTMESKQ